ncbi:MULTISPECIES: hypothetical protein [unclassified Streptomyces]|uniref:hypothetical protein n=1 Tax=unclassified Streptomyces TaxID=2593676 RepID=UPI00035E34A3|nr:MULTISPECIES: hypothetical protein [unclassified Streptomyces]MYX39061.1 hypothetical protein [Streptomyces sp. SID8377]
MSGVITSAAERLLAVEHWLASSALDPQRARDEWAERGFALLSCGSLFSAVRIPGDFVHAAAGTHDPQGIREYLADALAGPVIVDPVSQRYYALVPASVPLRWNVAGTVGLGQGSCLGVPHPDRTEPRHGRSYWSVPMDSAGMLCVPGDVALVARIGRSRHAAEEAQR